MDSKADRTFSAASWKKESENAVTLGVSWREAVTQKEAKRRILRVLKDHTANKYLSVQVRFYGTYERVTGCVLTCLYPRAERTLPKDIATRRMVGFVDEMREEKEVSTAFAYLGNNKPEGSIRFGVFSVGKTHFVVFPDCTVQSYTPEGVEGLFLLSQSEMASAARHPVKPPVWLSRVFHRQNPLFHLATYTTFTLPVGNIQPILDQFETSPWDRLSVERLSRLPTPYLSVHFSMSVAEEVAIHASAPDGFLSEYKENLLRVHRDLPTLETETRFLLLAGEHQIPLQNFYELQSSFDFQTYVETSDLKTEIDLSSAFDVKIACSA